MIRSAAMPGRLAIDFGTSNTVIGLWDETLKQGMPVHVPDYGRMVDSGQGRISLVPSLIHYALGGRRWVGNQVLDRGLNESDRTFRWMKRYVTNRSPTRVNIDGRQLSNQDAASDFLSAVLTAAVAELSAEAEEIVLTVPVEAFEHYEEWLTGVAESVGLTRIRFIDEASAAALGYGVHIQSGDIYLVFDFGGGTLDVSVVVIEDEVNAAAGRHCRVLGKAGAELGGAAIDGWLYQEVLRKNRIDPADETARRLSRVLLAECERAKETLSSRTHTDVTVMNPDTGAVIGATFSRSDFEDLLDQHQAFTQMDGAIRRALNAARERGYTEEHIQSVLMVGGSSQIPSVQKAVSRIFGRERVRVDRPFDAVARGAAAFASGIDFFDHIQHDYSIRWLNPATGEHEFRPLVRRGTSYPTPGPVARLRVKATHDGQEHLGIAIIEVGEQRSGARSPVEIIFDPSGAARVVTVRPDEEALRSHFWINEENPTFLLADPPATRGAPRFEVEFGIDSQKRLTLTARDLQTGVTTHRDFPVIKLT